MNFSKKFLLLWIIFALLDPDSEYGSGSTDPIESGSNPDPDTDPQPWSARKSKCGFLWQGGDAIQCRTSAQYLPSNEEAAA
jgi:hypothetical protein